MAEAPAREGGSPLAMITRKVGPLPVWAYAALLLLAYVLYRHYKGGTTSSAPTDTTQTAANTYVPGFDAAGAGGGGGIGDTSLPNTVNNYYYGTQGSTQADGGGTSSGTTSTGSGTGGPQRGGGPSGEGPPGGGTTVTGAPIPGTGYGHGVDSGVPISHYSYTPAVSPIVTLQSVPTSAYTVPVKTQVGAGGSRAVVGRQGLS